MLYLYFAAAGFGLALLAASVLGLVEGAHDGDPGGADFHDGDAHAESAGSAFLRVRFWTWTLSAFGVAGSALHLLGVSKLAAFVGAVVIGGAVGTAVTLVFRGLRRAGVTTPLSTDSLEGAEGEVVLAVSEGRPGKIRLRVGDQDLELVANGGGEPLPLRSRVIVVRCVGGVAEVRPAPWND